LLCLISSNIENKKIEIFPHFADISDMQEKSLHIPDIEAFCGKKRVTAH
jgi:hypothetical protein